jgi:hypothetical protein
LAENDVAAAAFFLTAADPDRERIAVCDYRDYAFLGSRRQFDVCRPLWLPDQAALLDYLDDQSVAKQ